MEKPITLKIDLPKVPDIELVAVEGLRRLAEHIGIAGEKIGEAQILVTEAIINAFEHGGDGDNPVVKIEITIDSRELTIFVRDFGKGFAPGEVADPDIRKKLGAADKRGWGLKLMRTMSDDFKIDSDASGTRITIKKRL